MNTNIAPDYCGQKQPHAAHPWHTPPIYGAATVVTNHQCAGLTPTTRRETEPETDQPKEGDE